jgi:hypothetical protein
MKKRKLVLAAIGLSTIILLTGLMGCRPTVPTVTQLVAASPPETTYAVLPTINYAAQRLDVSIPPVTIPTTTATTVSTPTPPTTVNGIPRFTAQSLCDQWRGNPYAADKNYAGKAIQVVGAIGSFFKPFPASAVGFPSWVYQPGFALPTRNAAVNCYFDSSALLLTVLKGQAVIVQGICQASDGSGFIMLMSCSIISE